MDVESLREHINHHGIFGNSHWIAAHECFISLQPNLTSEQSVQEAVAEIDATDAPVVLPCHRLSFRLRWRFYFQKMTSILQCLLFCHLRDAWAQTLFTTTSCRWWPSLCGSNWADTFPTTDPEAGKLTAYEGPTKPSLLVFVTHPPWYLALLSHHVLPTQPTSQEDASGDR